MLQKPETSLRQGLGFVCQRPCPDGSRQLGGLGTGLGQGLGLLLAGETLAKPCCLAPSNAPHALTLGIPEWAPEKRRNPQNVFCCLWMWALGQVRLW